MLRPGCAHRIARVVALDCPVCAGAGLLQLHPAALELFDAESAAQAVALTREAIARRIDEPTSLLNARADLLADEVSELAAPLEATGRSTGPKAKGMLRDDYLKTKSGERILPLPDFALSMLLRRQVSAAGNVRDAVFPALTGNWRDPSAVAKQWRRVRDRLKFD